MRAENEFFASRAVADIKERSKEALTNSVSRGYPGPAVHHNNLWRARGPRKEGHTKTEQRPPAVQPSRPGVAVPSEKNKRLAKVQPLDGRELVIGLNGFLDKGWMGHSRKIDGRGECEGASKWDHGWVGWRHGQKSLKGCAHNGVGVDLVVDQETRRGSGSNRDWRYGRSCKLGGSRYRGTDGDSGGVENVIVDGQSNGAGIPGAYVYLILGNGSSFFVMTLLMIAFCCSSVLAANPSTFVVSTMTVSAIKNQPITVAEYSGLTASFNSAIFDQWLAAGTTTLQTLSSVPCPVQLQQQGSMGVFSSIAGYDFSNISDSQTYAALRQNVSARVKIVLTDTWCGPKPLPAGVSSFYACSDTPGVNMEIIENLGPVGGIVVDHEFGHNQGLHHQDCSTCTTRIMYPTATTANVDVTSSECQNYEH